MTDESSSVDSLQQLNARLRRFARERNWEQFHSPKNLAMALIAECAELVEHFQWLSEEQSLNLPPDKREEVALEMADILNDLSLSGITPSLSHILSQDI